MSLTAIESALQTALVAASPLMATDWPNVPFDDPGPNAPFQRVSFLHAPPVEDTMDAGYYRQEGILQVVLLYPANVGARPVNMRAQALRDAFPRAASFTADGITVVIDATPDIRPAYRDEDRYCVPVRIRYRCNVSGG